VSTEAGPSLQGRSVFLRPVVPEDYRSLRAVELSDDLGPRWRFRGGTPSPEQWSQVTWSSTLAQFLIVGRQSDRPIGVVAVHQANFQDGFAYMSAAGFEPSRPSPAMLIGLAIFLNYVFACWDFRKLYLEVPEYNYGRFSSVVDRYCRLEGRLRDHMYFNGRYWDQLTLAIYRERWGKEAEHLLRVAELR
jgi:RimJ/RimL family protein N-acetyltransferase